MESLKGFSRQSVNTGHHISSKIYSWLLLQLPCLDITVVLSVRRKLVELSPQLIWINILGGAVSSGSKAFLLKFTSMVSSRTLIISGTFLRRWGNLERIKKQSLLNSKTYFLKQCWLGGLIS